MTAFTIGVVGNPNCGKTTLFNALTGARQRVGNWTGVTVERKEGVYYYAGNQVRVIDLPGAYSLTAIAGMDCLDERVARDYVLGGEADLIVNIVDGLNLERNLALTAQLLETGRPMLVAVNMMDAVRRAGMRIDIRGLSQRLGCPVVPLAAGSAEGLDLLKAAIATKAAQPTAPSVRPGYDTGLEAALQRMHAPAAADAAAGGVDARWLAVRLLEGDDRACALAGARLRAMAAQEAESLAANANGRDVPTLIAEGRCSLAHEVADACVEGVPARRTRSDILDRVVLGRWLGLPLFLGVMYALFMLTIHVGGAFIDFFDIAVGMLAVDVPRHLLLHDFGAPEWLAVLLADGIGGGIRVVATFVPIIATLYLLLAILEDSGYMARAAFVMDRLMRTVGLPGKSFVPLLVGFGCNVPAVGASRTLERPRDRLLTVAMTPFMSCGARLAVYALFGAAFFPEHGATLVFALYAGGIAMAMLTALALRRSVLPGETAPFAMELPPYRLPRPGALLLHTWTRLRGFLLGAGRVIVVVIAALGFLNSWGTDGSFGNQDSEASVLSALGRAMTPVFAPMGIGADNWPATVGIFTGVFAKEAVVGSLDSLYSGLAGDGADKDRGRDEETIDLAAGFTAAFATIPDNLGRLAGLVADPVGYGLARDTGVTATTFGAMERRFDGTAGVLAYLVFILLYTPCTATIGAMVREVGGRWAGFITLWATAAAYGAGVLVYQLGTLERHPASSLAWAAVIAAASLVVVAALRRSWVRGALAVGITAPPVAPGCRTCSRCGEP